MCDHAPSREASMIVVRRDPMGNPTIWCDPCLAPLVTALNDAGMRTVASCCGHGRRPGRIDLADGTALWVDDAGRISRAAGLWPGINDEPATLDADPTPSRDCATCSGRGVWMDEPCSDCAPFYCYPCARGDHDEHKLAWVPDIRCECPTCTRCAIPYPHGPHVIDDGLLQVPCAGQPT